jgi:hypothetical protein
MNTKTVTEKKFNISVIINIITIIGFLVTIGTFIYSSGKKDEKISQQEIRITALETKVAQTNQQLSLQNDETIKVNTKLGLLLDYFHIADK